MLWFEEWGDKGVNVVSQKLFDLKFARLVKQNTALRRQNSIIVKRIGQIVNNQSHYLNKILKERGGYYQFIKERKRLRMEVQVFRKRFGRVHVIDVSRLNGQPTQILMLSRLDAKRLRYFLRVDHRFKYRKKYIGGGK